MEALGYRFAEPDVKLLLSYFAGGIGHTSSKLISDVKSSETIPDLE
jgi:hypothetical protein